MNSLMADLKSSNDTVKKKALYELLNTKLSPNDDLIMLYNIVKDIERSDSIPLRYFSKQAADKIETVAAESCISLDQHPLLQEIEESDTAEYIEKLNSPNRIERENAIYFLSIRSTHQHVVHKLEEFAEHTENEQEALIAIEAIEKIHERRQRSLEKAAPISKSAPQEQVNPSGSIETPSFEEQTEEESQIIESVLETEHKKQRSKKSYSIFSLVFILIVVVGVFVFNVYKNISYKNISTLPVNKTKPKLINSIMKIRVTHFWKLTEQKDYNALYAEFGFRDLSRQKYWEKYTLKGNDDYIFETPVIRNDNKRFSVIVDAEKDGKKYVMSHYWSKINNRWVPSSKIDVQKK